MTLLNYAYSCYRFREPDRNSDHANSCRNHTHNNNYGRNRLQKCTYSHTRLNVNGRGHRHSSHTHSSPAPHICNPHYSNHTVNTSSPSLQYSAVVLYLRMRIKRMDSMPLNQTSEESPPPKKKVESLDGVITKRQQQ